MDREAMARSQRRRQVEEALHDERGREAALAEQLEDVVAETEGPRIDEVVFARLEPEDAAFVGEVLQTTSLSDEDEEEDEADAFVLTFDGDEPDEEEPDSEIERLQDEIADSRRRQLAYERYLDALDA